MTQWATGHGNRAQSVIRLTDIRIRLQRSELRGIPGLYGTAPAAAPATAAPPIEARARTPDDALGAIPHLDERPCSDARTWLCFLAVLRRHRRRGCSQTGDWMGRYSQRPASGRV